MDDLSRLQGIYPENFVLISQLEVCQEGRSRRGVLGGHLGFLTGDMDDRFIPNVMNDVLLSQGSYPEQAKLGYRLAQSISFDYVWF